MADGTRRCRDNKGCVDDVPNCLSLKSRSGAPSVVRHSDRLLFEVRFPLHFRARTGSGKLGTGREKTYLRGFRVCVRTRKTDIRWEKFGSGQERQGLQSVCENSGKNRRSLHYALYPKYFQSFTARLKRLRKKSIPSEIAALSG